MKTYKSIEHLEKRCKRNNRKKVNVWDDTGIKVDGKFYKLYVYGDIEQNGLNKSYVVFTNIRTGNSIEIHYYLHRKDKGSRTNDIFEFVELWGL